MDLGKGKAVYAIEAEFCLVDVGGRAGIVDWDVIGGD